MDKKIIGVLSDTHGLLRDEVLEKFKNVDLIIHAGDVGDIKILDRLRELAPLVAVRGNVDINKEFDKLSKTEYIEFGEYNIFVIHNIDEINIDLKSSGINILIYGHSHIPKRESVEGILYLNPGSIGHKRFNNPISIATVELNSDGYNVDFIFVKE